MKEVIDFFRRLHDDNTREWFDAHRAEWTRVKGRFADFTGQLDRKSTRLNSSHVR